MEPPGAEKTSQDLKFPQVPVRTLAFYQHTVLFYLMIGLILFLAWRELRLTAGL